MTNGEKYKTTKERMDAFLGWCDRHGQECHAEKDYGAIMCAKCQFAWLDLKAEEEKPLPCPFCGGGCGSFTHRERNGNDIISTGYSMIDCPCGYSTKRFDTIEEAISAHNRVAKKCREGK